jgi:hypothetical protein
MLLRFALLCGITLRVAAAGAPLIDYVTSRHRIYSYRGLRRLRRRTDNDLRRGLHQSVVPVGNDGHTMI